MFAFGNAKADHAPATMLVFLVLILYIFVGVCTVCGLPHPLYVGDADLAAGHERVRDMAHHYEVVHIDTSHHERHVRQRRAVQGSSYSHPPTTSFQVNAFGKKFPLELELNTVLLPANFQLQTFKPNGDVVVDRDVVNCYYQGKIAGWSAGASHAVLSTCDGISGSFGTGPAGHWTENGTFFIEPLTSQPMGNGTHPHAVFKAGEAKMQNPNRKCGVPDHVNSSVNARHNDLNFESENGFPWNTNGHGNHQRVKRQTPTLNTLYVEMLIVMDSALYMRFNGDITLMNRRARSVANLLDTIYRPLNIRIPLVAVQIFNEGNRFPAHEHAGRMLDNFLAYRTASLKGEIHHDNAQLLTGVDFAGQTAGKATLSGMCTQTRSGGVNQDTGTVIRLVSIIAHEMGHNFGMAHDSELRNCECVLTIKGCIMAPVGTIPPQTLWSSCSVSDVSAFLGKGRGHCLSNTPVALFGKPECGDGFVDGAEECDCGTAEHCRCCNPATCRLHPNIQCDDGPCCKDCNYLPAGALCRPATNDCDFPEFCSGVTHVCGNDVYAQNLQPCGSGSFCHDGVCRTHDGQCKHTWGKLSTVAPQACYDYNTKGASGFNCRRDASGDAFIGCPVADVRCGTLECQGGDTYAYGGTEVVAVTSTILVRGDTPVLCKASYIQKLTTDIVDYVGYVADGTACAANSVCINQTCTDLSSVIIPPCPSRNDRTCSGNGVCSVLTTCYCRPGWAGVDCSKSSTARLDGAWTPWTVWSGCSESCGMLGVRLRTRDCNNPPPRNGGAPCSGDISSQGPCNRAVCPRPVNGSWSAWATWSSCTATCANGTRFRIRTCNSPPPRDGGRDCDGLPFETAFCSAGACPSWGAWSDWSACSQTCGGGQITRTGVCSTPGKCEAGGSIETFACNKGNCGTAPINGAWSQWMNAGPCSATCDYAARWQGRLCTQPAPANGGKGCSGTDIRTAVCPVPGCREWTPWGEFTTCSASCGGGSRGRLRTCAVAGRCDGTPVDVQRCGSLACDLPVDGQWAEWTAWSDVGGCKDCHTGSSRKRTRSCTSPPPMRGGSDCAGSSQENRPCTACTFSPTESGPFSPTESGSFSPTESGSFSPTESGSFSPTESGPSNSTESGPPDRASGGLSGGSIFGIVVALLGIATVAAIIAKAHLSAKAAPATDQTADSRQRQTVSGRRSVAAPTGVYHNVASDTAHQEQVLYSVAGSSGCSGNLGGEDEHYAVPWRDPSQGASPGASPGRPARPVRPAPYRSASKRAATPSKSVKPAEHAVPEKSSSTSASSASTRVLAFLKAGHHMPSRAFTLPDRGPDQEAALEPLVPCDPPTGVAESKSLHV